MIIKLFKKKNIPKSGKVSKKGGFTLIETFIAISILMISVAGPLTIAQRSLSSSQLARDQIVAYYLAQDAVEYIRDVRDNIAIGGLNSGVNINGHPNWIGLQGLDSCIGPTNYCRIDYSQNLLNSSSVIEACPGGVCGTLSYNDDIAGGAVGTHIYAYGSGGNWVPTYFTRKIQIQAGTNEALLTVTVSWQSALVGGVKTFSVTEDLFNWH